MSTNGSLVLHQRHGSGATVQQPAYPLCVFGGRKSSHHIIGDVSELAGPGQLFRGNYRPGPTEVPLARLAN